MSNLRGGIRIGSWPFRRKLSARVLDSLTKAKPGENAGIDEIFRLVKMRATIIVSAGLEGSLDLGDLSEYEILALAAARKDARAMGDAILASLIGKALGSKSYLAALPDDDREIAEMKAFAEYERSISQKMGME